MEAWAGIVAVGALAVAGAGFLAGWNEAKRRYWRQRARERLISHDGAPPQTHPTAEQLAREAAMRIAQAKHVAVSEFDAVRPVKETAIAHGPVTLAGGAEGWHEEPRAQ